jgi:hypothetical protein
LIVEVPDAETAVARWQAQLYQQASLGVPVHVAVSFLAPHVLDEAATATLADGQLTLASCFCFGGDRIGIPLRDSEDRHAIATDGSPMFDRGSACGPERDDQLYVRLAGLSETTSSTLVDGPVGSEA